MFKLSDFNTLPMSSKALFLMCGGGVVGGIIYYLNRFGNFLKGPMIWVIAGGLLLIIILFVLYKLILKKIQKSKAAPMEKGILKSSAPKNINDPDETARLEYLRNKFKEGMETYKVAGKNVYELPWYLVIGEPGSGKTEAIRHSNINFPPGLQDLLQGTGGTVNMNWWFSDDSVILDTAGRMVFDDVETGGTEEWKEFLHLLRKNRPNCPINGVLLVIPADTLIKDSLEEVEQKASKIAMQFDVIQRTLDVRFPVYVVISKCDLIQGFRDFFDDLNSHTEQNQIFGWSNPEPLDEQYNSQSVDDYFQSIRSWLNRRKFALIEDDLAQDSFTASRKPEFYFSFPSHLASISGKLKSYLDKVFSTSRTWSCKPLFFRGIYFTSSMREGAALDTELANFLNVELDKLEEDRVWGRDKSYFLKDLFINKIFPEKGLVTRATNANSAYTKRKASLLGICSGLIVLLIVLTGFSAYNWNKTVGGIKEYFSAKSWDIGNLKSISVVNDSGDFLGNKKMLFDSTGKELPRNEFYFDLSEKLKNFRQEGVPLMFKPAQLFSPGFVDQTVQAYGRLYKANVLWPIIKNALVELEEFEWGSYEDKNEAYINAVVALRQLIAARLGVDLESSLELKNQAKSYLEWPAEIVLNSESGSSNQAFKNLNRVYKDWFSKEADDAKFDLTEMLSSKTEGDKSAGKNQLAAFDDKIEKVIAEFAESWEKPNKNQKIKRFRVFISDLSSYKDYYNELFAEYPSDDVLPEEIKSSAVIEDAKKSVEKRIKELNSSYETIQESEFIESESLTDQWDDISEDYKKNVSDFIDFMKRDLQNYLKPGLVDSLKEKAGSEKQNEILNNAADSVSGLSEGSSEHPFKKAFASFVNKKLEDVKSSVKSFTGGDDYKKKVQDYHSFVLGKGERTLESCRNYASAIEGLLNKDFDKLSIFNFKDNWEDLAETVEDVQNNRAALADGKEFSAENFVSKFKMAELISKTVKKLPAEDSGLKELINENYSTNSNPDNFSTQFVFERGFSPPIAGKLKSGFEDLQKSFESDFSDSEYIKDEGKFTNYVNQEYEEYFKNYRDYWLYEYPQKFLDQYAASSKSWEEKYLKIKRANYLEKIELLLNDVDDAVGYYPYELTGSRIKDFQEDKDRVKLNSFTDDFDDVFGSWEALGKDVFEARRGILEGNLEDYFYSNSNEHKLLSYCCYKLTLSFIQTLADDYKSKFKSSVEELQEYLHRFPLNLNSDKELTAQGAAGYRENVASISFSNFAESPEFGVGDIDKELKTLFRPENIINPEYIKECDVLSKIIPEEGEEYYYKLAIESLEKQKSILNKFGSVQFNSRSLKTLDADYLFDEPVKYPSHNPSVISVNAYEYKTKRGKTASFSDETMWGGLKLWAGNRFEDNGVFKLPLHCQEEPHTDYHIILRLELFENKDCREEDKIDLPHLSTWQKAGNLGVDR
ncbi:type VI secretion protein IcmF/TssM N-terminal domain-containing protein [Sedimentisphaera salicampi]|uniref:Type VI secretion protein IcmF n=1 Tax=Sedimentisphaera salicampi TaxID=1941349 RepID=A0A1W6LMF3_9BACT|nr:type VI secretion protein IcmF/TssM N-terminal domain-containing protein [Sedimentisphaera salicampi]ARN56924.1 type VI secretion protein IcmF [Sedimentisphaera salicampi]